jgi:hypothetical protein
VPPRLAAVQRGDAMMEIPKKAHAGRRGGRLALGIALILLGCGRASFAAEGEPSKWEFEFEPYGWISGTYGTIGVDGHTAHLDVTPYDLLKSVFEGDALGAAGYLSARYERWSVFADVVGGGAKVDVDETIPTPFCALSVGARDTVRFVLADFGLGYQLGQWSLPSRRLPVALGVYAGARYVHLRDDLSDGVAVIGGKRFSGNVSDTLNWADPLIGFRWSVPVLDSLSLTFRGDIGGFGASSDLDWGLVFDMRYWLSWRPLSTRPYLAAGYRVVGFDRSPSAASSVDLQMRGPLAGMGFVF